MLNIISKSLVSSRTSGPQKVVKNLIKGLDLIKYPYVINQRLDCCQRLWIHDDTEALDRIGSLDKNIKIIIGPNLYVSFMDIPHELDLSRVIYLHPCFWSVDFWLKFGYKREGKLEVWPTGIDTEEFKLSEDKKDIVLVYFKQRFDEELEFVRTELKSKNIDFVVIRYGSYSEKKYKSLLSRCRYVIWLGRQESQGIALQEALSCNIPVLVCDVRYYGQRSDQKSLENFNNDQISYPGATSAPYFDDRCGIKIKNIKELPKALDFMEKNLTSFRPREFINSSLSLEKQARDLIEIYHRYFGLSFNGGYNELVLRRGVWKNKKLYYIFGVKLKDLIIKVLRYFGLYSK